MKEMKEIIEQITAMQKAAKQRASQDKPEILSSSVKPTKIDTLPFWPDATRGVPNGVLRSALFGAIKKGARRYMERERISAIEGIEIHYTGQRLDQGDLDVWETVLHVTRLQEIGEQCRFTAYSMLKLLGKTDTGKNRETLNKKLLRLKANGIEVKQGNFSYTGSLIEEVYKDDGTHGYIVVLNPKLLRLFSSDQFTQIDWKVRSSLNGQPLAQWLHGFYASHAKPFPISVSTLYQLCGSESTEKWKFLQTLKKALNAVTIASIQNEQQFIYEIRGDIVHINKTPSESQKRYLSKKKIKIFNK